MQFVRDAMAAWREDVHLPLTISIYLDGDDQRVLLEQWSVMYAPDGSENDQHAVGARRIGNNHLTGAARDVIQQLKEVCKKISVLLRALYSFMRLLPAHRLYRRSYPSNLSYEIHSTSSASLETHFERDAGISRYSFVPINTPFGFLKISTVYRLNCEQIRDEEESAPAIFKENFIIQDYVPSSPELLAQREDRMSLPSPSTPISRPGIEFEPDTEADHFSEQRRRSSPAQIVEEFANRRSQSISQPMAIPQAKTPTVYEESVASPRENGHVIHPHSYGDPDQLRGVVANPNVTAAPYGYGNVAIDRGNTPPTPHWTANSSGSGGHGLAGAATSYQEEGSQFPLSTPPRHPNSLLTLKNSRTFSSSTGSRRAGNDGTHFRSSLENFSLDDGSHHHQVPLSPSPSAGVYIDRASSGDRASTFTYGTRRKDSFNSAFTSDESEGSTAGRDGMIGNSPRLTPPFMYADAPRADSPASTSALVLRRASTESGTTPSGGRGVPVFASSPPFQANPTELLSTSPGYSYSKNYIRKGPSSLPMFVTTDQFQLGRPGGAAYRLNQAGVTGFAKSAGAANQDQKANQVVQARGFSSDLYEAGGGVWGISPDSPDAFGLALTGPSNSHRHRFLSSSGSAGGGDNSTSSQYDADDLSDLMLPFAIGDMDTLSTATTLTSTAGSDAGGRPSFGIESPGVNGSRGTSWDTASVGSFLNQLKNAPRLQMFQSNSATGASDLSREQQQQRRISEAGDKAQTETAPSSIQRNRTGSAAPQLLFEDELASFRSLRDELARDL